MNRVWWLDQRPTYIRDVCTWVDFHLPRIGRALMPIRCRECKRWSWKAHKMGCSVGKDLASRVAIFWRAMTIIAGVLAVEMAAIVFVLAPMTAGTPLWWLTFTVMGVLFASAPLVASRLLRDWWMPKR